MNKEKYYVPQFEDILLISELWEDEDSECTSYVLHKYTHLPTLFSLIENEEVYCKFLDMEDIKSLGWKVPTDSLNVYGKCEEYVFEASNGNYFWFSIYERFGIKRFVIHNGIDWDENNKYFDGTIDNKADLKKLMKQIGIS